MWPNTRIKLDAEDWPEDLPEDLPTRQKMHHQLRLQFGPWDTEELPTALLNSMRARGQMPFARKSSFSSRLKGTLSGICVIDGGKFCTI